MKDITKGEMKMKVIETEIKKMFAEIREDIPNLNRLTFEISSERNRLYIYGFYHIGLGCESYEGVDELCAVFDKMRNKNRKNRILFRRF